LAKIRRRNELNCTNEKHLQVMEDKWYDHETITARKLICKAIFHNT